MRFEETPTNKELLEIRENDHVISEAYDRVHNQGEFYKAQFTDEFCKYVFEDEPVGLGLSNRQMAFIMNCGLGTVGKYRARYEKAKADEVILDEYDYSYIAELTLKEEINFQPVTVEDQLFLVVSDLQIGSYRVATGYDHDPIKTAIRYFDKLKEGLLDILERRSIAIKNFNIICLGDLVDGWDIYPNQSTIPMSMQMDVLAKQMLELIVFINDNIVPETINIYSVFGNHGRVSKRHMKGDNWDVIAMDRVDFTINYMKDKGRFKNVNSFISPERVQLHQIGAWTYLMTHGDQYGLRPKTNTIQKKSAGWVRSKGWHDAFLMGHWHQFRWFSIDGMQTLVGGCAYESPYVQDEIGGKEDLVQIVFGTSDKSPIAWVELIDMELEVDE